ncbi:hypothetical protein EL22_01010 [Halostagnicola sp. A56]|uniref:hypothetical protein n=1 Tax=Halostagnicola sp. A56 TaxID=1495067 RepID=UPI0004A0995F|nr:hypothetical protein [Halostagnicola sp. A56]KDE58977.1 hypothetical protein EL22_01010 [Halostagnicola sp. A56]
MDGIKLTRREEVVSGCLLVGLGGCNSLPTSLGNSPPPGADELTAGTVPAETDPLLLVFPDELEPDSAATTIAAGLLESSPFTELSAGLADLVTGSSSETASAVGKVAVLGSNAGSGSAGVVWAEWSDDELVALLEQSGQDATEAETADGRTIHEAGGQSAVVLGEHVFAIGTDDLVRSVVDVWHGDGDPVSDAVLGPFERTDRESPVRFATTGRAFHDDPTPPRRAAYDPVTNTSISITSGDGDATVDIAYQVDSTDAAESLADALRTDLGLETTADAIDPVLPRGIRNDLTVDRTSTVVSVRYQHSAEAVAEYGNDILTTLEAITGKQ